MNTNKMSLDAYFQLPFGGRLLESGTLNYNTCEQGSYVPALQEGDYLTPHTNDGSRLMSPLAECGLMTAERVRELTKELGCVPLKDEPVLYRPKPKRSNGRASRPRTGQLPILINNLRSMQPGESRRFECPLPVDLRRIRNAIALLWKQDGIRCKSKARGIQGACVVERIADPLVVVQERELFEQFGWR